MNLQDHQFKVRYSKATDDISEDFYLPCMRYAKRYDRISGYFRSTIFIIAWEALKDFVKRGGQMRIICSPFIPKSDQAAAEEGYTARSYPELVEALNKEIDAIFELDYLRDPARVLACLIADGVVELKIAVGVDAQTPDINKLVHEKSGIFEDEYGNVLAFEGSMNETFNGLSQDGNIEAIDVFVGWDNGRDAERVQNIQSNFEALWSKTNPRVRLFDFPEETKEILKKYSQNCNWEKIVDEIVENDIISNKWKADRKKSKRKPRKHQVQALETWNKNGRRGIFEHATGSGKTYTALCAIRSELERGSVPLVLVPSKELLYQWAKEFSDVFDDCSIKVLLCGDGNNAWKSNNLLYNYSTPSVNRKKAIIAVMDTASGDDFINGLNQNDKLFIVADEVHRLGSPKRRKIFSIYSGSRLGLSATPRRFGDQEGTQAILDYFGGILEPKFSLEDAINAGVLTKYFYFPKLIRLSPSEQEEWNKVTKQISVEVAKKMSKAAAESASVFDNPYVKKLLLKRSRILKNASAKVQLALDVITEYFKNGQKWIIYCDNQTQLQMVLNGINQIKGIEGLSAYEYHSAMKGDREETLQYFQMYGGVLVSIKCLDEGVDIPSTTHALILASSKNPREFIQRRGRILRRADSFGKMFAYLYDAVVVPNSFDPDNVKQASILECELARAIQFGTWSENKAICITELRDIAIKFEIDVENMLKEGNESEDED